MSSFTSSPASARRRSAAGLSLVVTSGLLWGTGGLLGTLFGRTAGVSALAVAAYRLAVGGMLIVVLLMLAGRALPRGRAAWTRIAQIGLLAALFQGSFFAAVALTSVSLATLVTIGTAPVLALTVEWATGRRRIDHRLLLTVCLALTGLGLLVGLPSSGSGSAAGLAGTGLSVAAAGGFAVVSLIGTRPVPGLDDLTATGLGFTLGAAVLIPLAASTFGLSFLPGTATIGLLLALGVIPTALAYTLYFRGLRTVPASTATLLALLEPLTGAVLAALVLGDRLGAAGLAGAALLGAAVVLATRISQE